MTFACVICVTDRLEKKKKKKSSPVSVRGIPNGAIFKVVYIPLSITNYGRQEVGNNHLPHGCCVDAEDLQ